MFLVMIYALHTHTCSPHFSSEALDRDPQHYGETHIYQVREEFWQCIMASQADEIKLIYNGESVIFDCPGRRIAVGAVEDIFGLKKILFDNKCYPMDGTGLTYKRFGKDIKSLTVTGVPAGELTCPNAQCMPNLHLRPFACFITTSHGANNCYPLNNVKTKPCATQ